MQHRQQVLADDTNATSETMNVTTDSASRTSLTRAMSTPASTVQTPIRIRTGMNS